MAYKPNVMLVKKKLSKLAMQGVVSGARVTHTFYWGDEMQHSSRHTGYISSIRKSDGQITISDTKEAPGHYITYALALGTTGSKLKVHKKKDNPFLK